MAHAVLMPKPGQMTEECSLVAWYKNEGDAIHKGDVLFEIETDKTNMDVEAFDEGVLLRRYVAEGETVPVNSLCAYVGEPGEVVPDVAPKTVAIETIRVEAVEVAAAVAPVASGIQTPTDGRAPERLRISPRASRLAAESGVDPRTVLGTGPEGRVVERDIQSALAARVVAPAPAPAAAAAPAPLAYSWAETEEEPPQPLSRMRRVIAERLTFSATTVPQFTVTVAVDMTRLVTLRSDLRAVGTTLSITDFVLAAAARTLVEYPTVNSRTDGTSIWLRKRVHLGLAVALPEGLVVPVVRDADRLSLTGLHVRAIELAEGARKGSLGPDDLTGSTFTISNLGMHGVDEFQAIINPGESAILAVASVTPTVVAVGDGFGIRQIMKMTLTADHRIVDGELAARFLNAMRRRLEEASAYRAELLNS